MISLNLENLYGVAGEHGLSAAEISEQSGKIEGFLTKFEARDQGFYQIVDDAGLIERVKSYADSQKGKFEDIVILGIGGSALGTICLQQSLKHLFENQRRGRTVPRMHVLDNVDPTLIKEIDDVIDYQRTLFIVVTKSGGTPETLSQYFYFRSRCDEQGLATKDHFAFITDPEKGLLRKIAKEEGITAFEVPPNIGGRFSVLTAVGLVPAALIGIEIEKLMTGAQKIRDQFLDNNFENNLPFQLATIQYLLAEKGKVMNVLMPYSQRLIRFADWYRQLLAESIGKALNEKGETANVGLTPINALGATDQHSQSQLYNEGPNDKFFMFIEVKNVGPAVKIPNLYPEDETVSFLNDVDFGQLLNTEKKGTAMALTHNDRPNLTIEIDEVNAETLGELFMLFEAATTFLGEHYGINAFDQPGVELSKTLTKQLLLGEEITF